jgi:peptidoglycan hydrolase-like protein with peptidoglycan-binding domain
MHRSRHRTSRSVTRRMGARQAAAPAARARAVGPVDAVRHLQRTAGNAVATRLLRASLAKEELGREPDDEPMCAECAKASRPGLFRTASSGAHAPAVPASVGEVLRSPGRALDASVRSRMEHHFAGVGGAVSQTPAALSPSSLEIGSAGSPLEREADAMADRSRPAASPAGSSIRPDFGGVRIHTDARAAESARAVDAKAYAVGNHVVFGAGRYQPGSAAGDRLLAHELTHTLQQGGGVQPARLQRTIGDGHDLVAPRFSGNVTLEAAFDDELLISVNSRRTGTHVRLIQESLLAQGYTLPQFGADGIYGAETKAAIEAFQRDAGAVRVDGIVGPETMGLLDQRDTTNRGGLGPPGRVGPQPGPRPAPAVGCDAPFAGVTFTLAAAAGSGVAPAAAIRLVRQGGREFLFMQGIAHPNYRPQITITAPNAAAANNFEAGLIQNLLFDNVTYSYAGGTQVISALPVPIKDGAPLASGVYDTVFAENGGGHPAVLLPFAGTPSTVTLDLPDVPSDGAFINALDNPECGGGQTAGRMTRGRLVDDFRTWVGVRHRPSGCVRTIHHIDWRAEFDVTVVSFGATTIPVTVTNAITVSVANGNGAPGFVMGGPVANDLLAANRTCV